MRSLKNEPGIARQSKRPKTTRLPVAPGSLKPTYEDRKLVSRAAAEAILKAILESEDPVVNKRNWEEKKAELDEPCDWRTTYAPHLEDLFAQYRRAAAGGDTGRKLKERDRQIAQLTTCVEERDERIKKLEERIGQLEWDNLRMSRGTRERRRRKPVQGRQSGSADTGSEASAT